MITMTNEIKFSEIYGITTIVCQKQMKVVVHLRKLNNFMRTVKSDFFNCM